MLEGAAALTEQLSGRAPGLEVPTCRGSLERWGEVWAEAPGLRSDVLPSWIMARLDSLRASYDGLLGHANGDHVVHGDLRNDNMIMRTGDQAGSVVFVDWGMARTGPAWFDPLLLCLEWIDDPVFDDLVHTFPALQRLGDQNVTAFLVTLGSWLAYRSTVARDINLPTLNDFRKREAARVLEGARRRLGVGAG